MKRLLLLCSALVLVGLWPARSDAFINTSFSLGEGVQWVNKKAYRTPVNLEIMPSISYLLFKFDLGFVVAVERPSNFYLRPGARVCLPWLYFRAAAPLRLTHGFDYGFLVGMGKDLLSIGIASFFLEVDTFFTRKGGFSTVPVEGRVGVSLGF